MVRRLPVLQSKAADDSAAENRPAWHWVLIGAVFVVTFFLPLSILGLRVGGFIAAAQWLPMLVAISGAVLLGFAFSAGASGALVARFSGARGRRTAVLGGALGGSVTFLFGVFGAPRYSVAEAAAAGVVLCGGGALFAAVGARLATRARAK